MRFFQAFQWPASLARRAIGHGHTWHQVVLRGCANGGAGDSVSERDKPRAKRYAQAAIRAIDAHLPGIGHTRLERTRERGDQHPADITQRQSLGKWVAVGVVIDRELI